MTGSKLVLITLALVALVHCVEVDPVFNLIGSGMVLQRDSTNTKIWGESTAQVTVELYKDSQLLETYSTMSVNKKWVVTLKSHAAGGPYEITVKTVSATTKYNDIYFGDVFLCSGQSNMGFTVNRSFNATNEIADSIHYPHLRLFQVKRADSDTPQTNVGGKWATSSPLSVPGFSAVCYYYGRDVYKFLNEKVPIGLIESSWGGTRIEAWMSPDARKVCNDTDSANDQNTASHLWNGMIYPLLNVNIKGALWYQGEANAGKPERYKCSFPAMIHDWRQKFSSGEFPFFYVELAAYGNKAFPDARAAQASAFTLKHVGMASAIDCGNVTDIHPIYKQIPAHRLALNAANLIYGDKNVVYDGPRYKHIMQSVSGNTAQITVQYDQTDLVFKGTVGCTTCCGHANNGTYQLQTNKRTWFDSTTAVIKAGGSVQADFALEAGEKVVSVRYAWYPFSECLLFNKQTGIPSSEFFAHL